MKAERLPEACNDQRSIVLGHGASSPVSSAAAAGRYRKGTTNPVRGLSRHCHASADAQASPATRNGHITV